MAGHPHTTESKLKLSNSMKGKGHKPIPIGSRFGMLTVKMIRQNMFVEDYEAVEKMQSIARTALD